MRWKRFAEFLTSGIGGYFLRVDSGCVFTLRINSVDQDHEGNFRCELDGVNNEDPPISAERTLKIARESGCPSVCLSACLPVCLSACLVKYFQSGTQSFY